MKRLLLFLLLVFSAIALHTQPADRYVVIAVIDGARFTETLGDRIISTFPSLEYAPSAGDCLYVLLQQRSDITTPGHSSILSGSGSTSQTTAASIRIRRRFFEYYRKAFAVRQTMCGYSGKKKLVVLAASDAAGYGNSYAATVNRLTLPSTTTTAHRRQRAPGDPVGTSRISIINFPETDNAAHQADKPWYLKAIHGADSLIVDLWSGFREIRCFMAKLLCSSQTITAGTWTCEEGFIDHGDSCAGCRHIMCIAVGPISRRVLSRMPCGNKLILLRPSEHFWFSNALRRRTGYAVGCFETCGTRTKSQQSVR